MERTVRCDADGARVLRTIHGWAVVTGELGRFLYLQAPEQWSSRQKFWPSEEKAREALGGRAST